MESHQIIQHNILFSCTYQKEQSAEQFLPEHSLGIVLSGQVEYFTNEGSFLIKEGTIGLMHRNQLVKKIKKPAPNGAPFKLIGVFFEQETLRQYASENDIPHQNPYKGPHIINLTENPVMRGFFDSLLPYENNPAQLSLKMSAIKTREAIELLLQVDGNFKTFLFDFQEPHKIDLENFMSLNYKFNVSLPTFAKLTGRSLSTFKRDFAKIFNATPEKWIQQKRLEMAHYLIAKKNKRPSDVYLEVGFENLSHFSFAFKKQYELTPTELTKESRGVFR